MNPVCPIECRKGAIEILEKLRSAGFETYFAGGCVRDRLLSGSPSEYDIATSARPEDIKKLFPKARSVGESFGVMLVRMQNSIYDVATFRSDGPYSDKRHPDEITFSDAKHDALRRDFTINGMFEDPIEEKIIDFVGGKEDLQNRIVRAIGDPNKRISEDHLRMLRAIRFASRFEFSIETETANAIREHSHELRGVSRERIGEELRKMLTNTNRGVAAWELQYLGLDRFILEEESCMNAPTRVGRLPASATYATALAAWIFDRYTSDSDVQAAASNWRKRLLLSNKTYDDLSIILELHQKLYFWDSLGTAQQKRTSASNLCNSALSIIQCEDRSHFVHIRREILNLERSGLAPERLINGNDLLEAGIPPSSVLGEVLESVYDAQLEGSITNRTQAIQLAQAIYRDFLDS
ncbi:MAG: CCA tRNA nucleotidyltransferase [Phycisphaerales bacterium]|nr:CCA tRNA nucleotidyltransferase [Planctomycetota bacterium]MBL6997926.1 CCA tRNA nucleotidyltransferase [Phycisphaerales bacterium]